MRAINHALTGALIGLTITEPAVALPVALASHYVLDVIPHSGVGTNQTKQRNFIRSKIFRYLIYADAIACIALVVVFMVSRPLNWLLACACAFLAAAPDFFSFNRWRKLVTRKKFKPSLYSVFAARIQWFERPIGIVVEVCWFIGVVVLISPFFR